MKFRKAHQGEFIQSKDYTKQIIFSFGDFLQKGHQVQVVTIPPQTKQRKHSHFKQTEVVYLLEGKASFFVDDKEMEMEVGDAITYDHGESHFVWNKSDSPCKLLVCKIDLPEKENDTQWLEE